MPDAVHSEAAFNSAVKKKCHESNPGDQSRLSSDPSRAWRAVAQRLPGIQNPAANWR